MAKKASTVGNSVRDWLLEEGFPISYEDGDGLKWMWVTNLQSGLRVMVSERSDSPNKVTVVGLGSLDPRYAVEFSQFSPLEKNAFVAECQRELVISGCVFGGNWNNIQALAFVKSVYLEELTLPTLAKAMGAVNNGWLLVCNIVVNAFPGVWEQITGVTPTAPIGTIGRKLGFRPGAPQPEENPENLLDKPENL